MRANCAAKCLYSLINDAVKHRITIAAFGKYLCLVEHLQVLRQVGLGRLDTGDKFANCLFAFTKAIDDF